MQTLPKTSFPLAFSLAMLSTPAVAQEPPRMSQHGTVSQTITGTTITVEYDRPTARGRDLKEQDIIHFGRFWTPGANWATTLEVDGNITIEGQALNTGKYSMWMIPGDDSWTVVLSEDDHVFHTRTPDETKEALRFTVDAVDGSDVDALSFYFPEVSGHTTTLNFHWGPFVVPMHIEVTPWPMATLGAEEFSTYTGDYLTDGGNALEVAVEDGVLVIKGLNFVDGETLQLVPKGHNTFNFGTIIAGELREIWIPRWETSFVVENGIATGIEMWIRGRLREEIPRQ